MGSHEPNVGVVGDLVTVNSRNFDGTIRKTWTCRRLKSGPGVLALVGEFETAVDHPKLGNIRPGTVSYEYYWPGRWYNVFCFHESGGELRNYYCNINMPPHFQDAVLDYVDLDIDVLVWPDLSYEILDVEEFEFNLVKYEYPATVERSVRNAVGEIVDLIKRRAFPFDQKSN